jgi:hypothetical protein
MRTATGLAIIALDAIGTIAWVAQYLADQTRVQLERIDELAERDA